MEINLLVHIEAIEEEKKVVWWAESEELPGFSSAADHLPELLSLCREAIADMGFEDVTIRPSLAGPSNDTRGGLDNPPRSLPARWSASDVAIAPKPQIPEFV